MAYFRFACLASGIFVALASVRAAGAGVETQSIDLKCTVPAEQQIGVATIAGPEHLSVGMACRIDTEVKPDSASTIRGSYYGTVKKADKDGVVLSAVYFREQREKKSRLDRIRYLEGLIRPALARGSLDNKEMYFPTSAITQITWRGIDALAEAKAAAQQNPAIVVTDLPEDRLRQIIDQTRLNSLALTDWHSVTSASPGALCRVEASEKNGAETTFIVYEGTVKQADKNGILLTTTRRKEWKDAARPILQQIPLVDFFYVPKPADVAWEELNNQSVWIPANNIHDVMVPRSKTLANAK
jgi:hypothetical protein